MIVVDDLLLLHVLAARSSPAIDPYFDAASRGKVFTTGSWYWRAARGVSRPGRGIFSGYLGTLTEEDRFRVRASVDQLPDGIGVLSLRRLVPVMAALPGQLNLLTAEAVAAAVVLDATLAVTTESNLLNNAAESAGVPVDVVDLRG
jgi:hypothetical protein